MASLFEKIALGLGESLKGAQSGMALIEEIKKRKREEEEIANRKAYMESQLALQNARFNEEKRGNKVIEDLNKENHDLEERKLTATTEGAVKRLQDRIDANESEMRILRERMATDKLDYARGLLRAEEGSQGAADKAELRAMDMEIARLEYLKKTGKITPDDLIKLEIAYRQRAVLTGKPYKEPPQIETPQTGQNGGFWSHIFAPEALTDLFGKSNQTQPSGGYNAFPLVNNPPPILNQPSATNTSPFMSPDVTNMGNTTGTAMNSIDSTLFNQLPPNQNIAFGGQPINVYSEPPVRNFSTDSILRFLFPGTVNKPQFQVKQPPSPINAQKPSTNLSQLYFNGLISYDDYKKLSGVIGDESNSGTFTTPPETNLVKMFEGNKSNNSSPEQLYYDEIISLDQLLKLKGQIR